MAEEDEGLRGEGEPRERDAEEYFKAGLFLLKRDRTKEALAAFKKAFASKSGDPRYMSYTGLCMALAEGRTKEGIDLCEKAVRKEFFRPELFLNLGRVYLHSGNRKKAHLAFRKGLSLDRENMGIRQELDRMGVRKPPVFPFLDRKHPINKFAGKVLHKIRLR